METARTDLPFSQIVEALLDESRPFPEVLLHRFSDIEPENLQAVREIWTRVAEKRRAVLLSDLETLADSDTLVNFDDMAKFAMKDTQPEVRSNAIRLLWESDDQRLIPMFLETMASDPDDMVRASAASGLGIFVYKGELEEVPLGKFKVIEERLLNAIRNDKAVVVRRRALEAMGFSCREEMVELIQEAFNSDEKDWMISALFAMGRSADKDRWGKSVLLMVDHPDDDIRYEAVKAAGELSLSPARRPLLKMVKDREELNDDVWSAAIWSLSQIGGEGIQKTFENLLGDAADDEETALLEDALENLSFTVEVNSFSLLDVDPDQEETDSIIEVDELEDEDDEDEEDDRFEDEDLEDF